MKRANFDSLLESISREINGTDIPEQNFSVSIEKRGEPLTAELLRQIIQQGAHSNGFLMDIGDIVCAEDQDVPELPPTPLTRVEILREIDGRG